MDSNRKKQASEWFYQTLYRDERILPRQGGSHETVPEEIRAMRSLEAGMEAWRQPREAVFVRQARLMENYEDDYAYNRDVVRYFPTYQSLTDRELRAYFSWRTAWRRGERRKTNLSFAFLYIYELLNQIGVDDPVDGYDKLTGFQEEYGVLDDGICSYLHSWLWDYVIYYRLDPVLLAEREELRFDRHLSVLREMDPRSDKEIMEAVLALSSYRLDRSKLYLTEPDAVTAVTVRVLRRMSAYYDKHRKQTLTEDYFGPQTLRPVEMFHAAVFYNQTRRESFDYEVDACRSYHCRNGQWSVKEPDAPVTRSKKLGGLVRTVDSMLRESVSIGNSLQPGLSTKWIVKLIGEEIEAYSREKQAEEARKIHIDYSKLSGIRADASVTRDKLIVDEEKEEPEETHAPVRESQASEIPAETALDANEYRLLQSLLYDRSINWVREQGLLLSVLVDGVNEKLYDQFEDTVLLLEAEPTLVEDYVEDLKEMIQP